MAFVVGLAAGVVGCRLVLGRGRSTEKLALAAPTEPEPAALPTSVEAPVKASAEEPAEAPVEASAEEPADDPASAVDDVVAELERRVKGRRSEGETDRTTGGRRGRSE